jgi:hypothetical protein
MGWVNLKTKKREDEEAANRAKTEKEKEKETGDVFATES